MAEAITAQGQRAQAALNPNGGGRSEGVCRDCGGPRLAIAHGSLRCDQCRDAWELKRLISRQANDMRSHTVIRQRFTTASGDRAYVICIDGVDRDPADAF